MTMKIIAHRRNTRAELDTTEKKFGVEIDLRSWDNQLILQHDPFKPGESFESWLNGFRHSTLILNVKEDGLENTILESLHERNIEDFFFLDLPFPSLVRMARQGESRCAVRISEFESIESAIRLSDFVDWVWIDSFRAFSFQESDLSPLVELGYQTCLVSPELQGKEPELSIPSICREISGWEIKLDAVCTKRPDLWQRYI